MNRPRPTPPQPSMTGFSLVELALVLIVAALLAGSFITAARGQRDQTARQQTQQQLVDAQEALLGFFLAQGRFPCPMPPGQGGVAREMPEGGGDCLAWSGYLPGTTLGLGPTDEAGYVLDAWGQRLHYQVSSVAIGAQSHGFTTANGLRSNWASLAAPPAPDLWVCPGADTCSAATALTREGLVVIFSTGANGETPRGADETANLDGDNHLVSHPPTPADHPQGAFDDQLLWLSPVILYSRLTAAGRLP